MQTPNCPTMAPVGLLDLPDEVILKIFNYLSVKEILLLETTCSSRLCLVLLRYWQRCKSLDLLKFLENNNDRNITCQSNAYTFDTTARSVIERVGGHLEHLALSRFGPLEHYLRVGLECAVLEHCCRLQSLDLSYRLLDNAWLIQVAKATKHLCHLDLSQVYIRYRGGLDDSTLATALERWSCLQSLKLQNNKLVRLVCFWALPTTLRDLDLLGCPVNSWHLNNTLQRCDQLEALSITYPPDVGHLQPLVNTLNGLKRLRIDCVGQSVSMQWLFQSIQATATLTRLTIASHLANDALLSLIGATLYNLEEFSLPGRRPGNFHNKQKALLHLRTLTKLKSIHANGNPIGRALLKACGRFKSLLEVDVSYAVREIDLHNLSSPVLRKLIAKGVHSTTGQNSAGRVQVKIELLNRLRFTCPLLDDVVL